MKQIISIHVGQAGVQIGNACWELFCLQHGITPCGNKIQHAGVQTGSNTLFSLTSQNKYLPRCVFIDLQPNVIDQIKTSSFRQLFDPQYLICHNQDASNVFYRGKMIGRQIAAQCLDKIRKLTENCDNFQGFLMFHSIGGGTGSGLVSFLLQMLGIQHTKKYKLNLTVCPSPRISNSPLQPYNGVLALHELLQHSDSTIILDNQACYDIFHNNMDMDRPTYSNLNRLIAQMTASLTKSFNLSGILKMDLSIFHQNLIPYPRIRFMIPSYSPYVSSEDGYHPELTLQDMTIKCFQPTSTLAKCDLTQGKYMACSMLYRGDVIPKNVVDCMGAIRNKKNIRFVDWSPTGFKVSINQKAPLVVAGGEFGKVKKNCCVISNTTAMEQIISRLDTKFDQLYERRTFVHWYTYQGMENSIFREARQDLAALQKDYQEVGLQTVGLIQE